MFDFEKLSVYCKSKIFNTKIKALLKTNKTIDRFMSNQIRRASLSIPINIAEWSWRFTKNDKKYFYIIARGSLYEIISLLDIMKDDNIITWEEFLDYYKKWEEISKMLLGLIKSLK